MAEEIVIKTKCHRRVCPIHREILQLQTVCICCLEVGMSPSVMLSGMVSQAGCLVFKDNTDNFCQSYNPRLGNSITNTNF